MPLDLTNVEAILFDYGNTLIPFGVDEVAHCDEALRRVLEDRFGPVNRAHLTRLRDADRLRPYRDGFRENDVSEITVELVRELFGVEPSAEDLALLLRSRRESFVECVHASPDVAPLLSEICRHYKLGFVSNYPDVAAIEETLRRNDLARLFEAVVISGGVGFAKPHPKPFEVCLGQLGVTAGQAIYVGDKWLPDVQGPKRLGMQAVLVTQYAPNPAEQTHPQPGDHHPDATIAHLSDLVALLRS